MLSRLPYLPATSARRGAILLIVLVLLSLFMVLGLAFVLYANAQATSARLAVDAETQTGPDMDPQALANFFLQRFLCDQRDDNTGVYSALRGHSLLRNMYGMNYTFNSNGTLQLVNNTVPFNGVGRLHGPSFFAGVPSAPAEATDDFNLVNYTYYAGDGFLRDPERLGYREDLTDAAGAYAGGCNASYTYPDLNNMYLALVKSDGTVALPSFHRPWTGFGSLDPANPNWTDTSKPWLKYMTLRPRPAEHPTMYGNPGFPLPSDAGGDVKNLIGASGGNDSIWLNLGAPVMTTATGVKYKALFAPLIIDLDGRVNLNAHGNVRGLVDTHVSNQGWGPWEVALSRVLTADPTETKNLFLGVKDQSGTVRVPGRYGVDQRPTPTPLATLAGFGPTPHFYNRVDFDGCQVGGFVSDPLALPSAQNCFPTFGRGYDNANLVECTNHPALFNILGPPGRNATGADRRFGLWNMDGLLRFGDVGSDSAFPELMGFCPRNFADARIRRLVTTESGDVDRPGIVPWIADTMNFGALVRDARYPYVPDKILGGGPKSFRGDPSGFAPSGEIGADGRALDAGLGRIDLNRALPDYPPADPSTGQTTNIAGFLAAQGARQSLASDIFLRLIKITGAYDPTTYFSPGRPSTTSAPAYTDLNTLRWLAQFSANIVDAVDTDDYMTPFNWGGAVGTPTFSSQYGNEWVFGTELPRVVLNEAYVEYDNLPGETGPDIRATAYNVNVWLELFNPFVSDLTLRDGGAARLDATHQILLTRPNNSLLSGADVNNVLGDPDGTGPNQAYAPGQVYQALGHFNPPSIGTTDQANGGFYVIGPAEPVPGFRPGIPLMPAGKQAAQAAEMSYQVPVKPGQVSAPPNLTILLRRLACPTLPYQPNPATPLYNPWVTVDCMSNLAPNRGITNNGTGPAGPPTSLIRRQSIGRTQPYDGNPTNSIAQAPSPLAGQPQHTFFVANQPVNGSFDWLVHFDRPLISPVELLHVSCSKPHQLTQLFKNPNGGPYMSFNHAPYWLTTDATSPLSRMFEVLETGCRAGGVRLGGRIPGKINLNSVWDPEILDALCDAQASNYFNAADVRQIFKALLSSRSPAGQPAAGDKPFKSLGNAYFTPSGTYPEANGLNDTILRANPSHPFYDAAKRPIRLFELVKQPLAGDMIQEHPVQRFELLNKIFNQVTTRSNVFAVWVTVGFFAVNDDSTLPVKLGAEIGRPQGANIRHRFFAIVDRTNAVPIFPPAGTLPLTSTTAVTAPGAAVVTPSLMSGYTPDGSVAWSIQPGMVLRVAGKDAGVTQSEDILVTAVGSATFSAVFSRAYPNGLSSITAFGNPGPAGVPRGASWSALVPYSVIIN